jgi:hypothetical protein
MNPYSILRWRLVSSGFIKTMASFNLYQKARKNLLNFRVKEKATRSYQKMDKTLRN